MDYFCPIPFNETKSLMCLMSWPIKSPSKGSLSILVCNSSKTRNSSWTGVVHEAHLSHTELDQTGFYSFIKAREGPGSKLDKIYNLKIKMLLFFTFPN